MSRRKPRRGVPARATRDTPVLVTTRLTSITGRISMLLAARWMLPVILLVALALRVGHLLALQSTLWFEQLDLDPLYFDEWGQRIAAGDWIGNRMFFVDPLYPYFLGGLYAVFGH